MKNNRSSILIISAIIIIIAAQGCSKSYDNNSATPNYNNNNNMGLNLTLGSNSPVAVGGTLNLTASTISNASYSWTGPASFSSAAQNPTRPNFALADTGTYSCYVINSSYQSATATIKVSAH
jgi:hypothetical protein